MSDGESPTAAAGGIKNNQRILKTTRQIAAGLGVACAAALSLFTACDDLITEQTVVIIDLQAEFVVVCPDGSISDTGCIGCAPFVVNFQDTSTGRRTSWVWSFGDGKSSTQANPTHTYDSAGLYRVSLTITDDTTAVSDIEIKNRFILVGDPAGGFTASDSLGVQGQTINFTPVPPSAVAESWLWDFGDGQTDTARAPSHIYNSEGVFDVTLTTFCFSDSTAPDSAQFVDSGLIGIVAAPAVNFVAQRSFSCVPSTVTFIDSTPDPLPGIVQAWQWDFGNGQTGSNPQAVVTYTAPGDYWVRLTVTTNLGGFATDSMLITAYDLPTARFISTDTVSCFSALLPFQVSFTDQSLGDISGYFWAFGDGGTSIDTNPVHSYASPGAYPVTLQVTGTCDPTGAFTFTNTLVRPGMVIVADTLHTDSVSFNL
ncbi:MAG: PKD domain-containing protein, partial [Candidatus Zixiibacteriota bacterium]